MYDSILPRTPYNRWLMSVGEGGEGDPGTGGGGDGGESGGGGTGNSNRTFSQADVDAMVQDRLAREKRSSAQKVADELGMTLDEAKAFIADRKKREDEAKDELTKLREQIDADKANNGKATAEAKQLVLSTKIERALVRAGVELDKDEAKADERLARLARLVDVEDDADDTAIKSAVEKLRKDEPALFGSNGKKTPPPSDPDGKPERTQHMQDAFEKGKQRAEKLATTSASGTGKGIGGYDL